MVKPINSLEIAQQTQVAARQSASAGYFGTTLRQAQPAQRAPTRAVTMLHAQRLAAWAPMIKASAARNGVPVELICGVMLQESGGNPKALSHCGATGLMQLMPATAKRMGVTEIWNPAQNIEGGTRYLRYLTDFFRGDTRKVVAAYNAGEGAVKKYGGVPPFKETQNYVPAVLGFTQSVGNMLRGVRMPMRQMVQATMPRHAVNNFVPQPAPQQSPQVNSTRAAQRLVRL